MFLNCVYVFCFSFACIYFIVLLFIDLIKNMTLKRELLKSSSQSVSDKIQDGDLFSEPFRYPFV